MKGSTVNHVLRAPARAYSPAELREVLSSGLMSFPLTDFDENPIWLPGQQPDEADTARQSTPECW